MDVKGIIREVRPDTNNLIVLAVTGIVIFAMIRMPEHATRLADTGIGGLLGYLGATMKGVYKSPIPDDVITGVKT